MISDLYAAYEYCDAPNLAAEIHTIWNTLLFNPIEDDNALSMQLKTLRCHEKWRMTRRTKRCFVLQEVDTAGRDILK